MREQLPSDTCLQSIAHNTSATAPPAGWMTRPIHRACTLYFQYVHDIPEIGSCGHVFMPPRPLSATLETVLPSTPHMWSMMSGRGGPRAQL